MSDKKKKAAILGLLAIGFLSFGTTWAYYYANDMSLGNPFATTHSGVVMVEEFDPGSSFLPGETVAKVVRFTNTGDMDLLLRVEVAPQEAWYDDEGEEAPKTDLDPEYVIKNWSENWATPANASGFDSQTDDDYMTDASGSKEWSEVYTDTVGGEAKSYRYYRKILPKDGTTAAILDSITLSREVSNDRHSSDYSDKTYKLTFNAEAVPVEAGDIQAGALNEWGMTATVDDSDGSVDWSEP
ncbi:MAG: BsaA family SipW-dependent biofilm matrix protein [Clostridiales bacterium]|nr:BsaA family SipW-dependent biofilm matrix protein [Clostridiales bacterium]